MPMYEFSCPQCNNVFTRFSALGEDGSSVDCPNCGHRPVQKKFSTFATAATSMKEASLSGSGSSCSSKGPFR